jgi:hypothetical protein
VFNILKNIQSNAFKGKKGDPAYVRFINKIQYILE